MSRAGICGFYHCCRAAVVRKRILLRIRDALAHHAPDCLLIDPISSLLKGNYPFASMICEALLDHAKSLGITVLCTSLLEQVSGNTELSASQVSTIADTWIHVSYVAREGERNRALTIVKSRGTDHSNQVRELISEPLRHRFGRCLCGRGRSPDGQRPRPEGSRSQVGLPSWLILKRSAAVSISTVRSRNLKPALRPRPLEFEWKQQEIEFQRVADSKGLEMGQAAAIHRLDLRRSADDMARGSSGRNETKRVP